MGQIKEKIEKYNQEHFTELNGRRIIGVSKINDYLTEPFDKEKQAEACAAKGATDPNNKYYGLSAQEIIKMWEDKAAVSCQYGMKLDEYAECVFDGNENKKELWKLDNNYEYDERLKAITTGLDEFVSEINALGFIFIDREVPVYVESVDKDGNVNIVTGRLDALFYNPELDRYAIVDWKTTDDIKVQAFRSKRMKGPAFGYDDCDMSKYSIQLFNYKHALVDTYKIALPNQISAFVVNLLKTPREDNGRYFRLVQTNIPYQPDVLDSIVEFAIKKRDLLKSIG